MWIKVSSNKTGHSLMNVNSILEIKDSVRVDYDDTVYRFEITYSRDHPTTRGDMWRVDTNVRIDCGDGIVRNLEELHEKLNYRERMK